jgi:hypothetical protein
MGGSSSKTNLIHNIDVNTTWTSRTTNIESLFKKVNYLWFYSNDKNTGYRFMTPEISKTLEQQYLLGNTSVKLGRHRFNFVKGIQTNITTGFTRKIGRITLKQFTKQKNKCLNYFRSRPNIEYWMFKLNDKYFLLPPNYQEKLRKSSNQKITITTNTGKETISKNELVSSFDTGDITVYDNYNNVLNISDGRIKLDTYYV